MMVRFRYSDLVKAAKFRPPGYLETVLNSARRVGPDVVMSRDAYNHMKDWFRVDVPATNVPRLSVPRCCSHGHAKVTGDKQ